MSKPILWENTGAPFRLSDGREVPKHAVFRASAEDRDVRMRRHKLEPALAGDRPTVPPKVRFASTAAEEAASETGLLAEDFDRVEPTGQDGTYRKSDVEQVIQARSG